MNNQSQKLDSKVKRTVALSVAGILALGVFACKKMGGGDASIQKGSTVQMDYTLTVDGKVVDSSVGKKPLTFVEGSGQIIPGLDADLMGLKIGDKKQFVIPPALGYGMEDPKAFVKVPKKSFKNSATLKVGSAVSGSQGGRRFQAVVSAIGGKTITLDFNSPLAGKTLNFDVSIVGVEPAKS